MSKVELKVDSPVKYDGRFPYFREPEEIGYFSLDSHRNYCDDKHQLKYLVLPHKLSNLHMDLNKGYSKAITKDFAKYEKIDTILKWILSNEEQVKRHFIDSNNGKKVNFVCFRGLLTAISSTIYENQDDWLICATKFKSVIYLCAFDTEQDIQNREKRTGREKLMSSWGYKFEQYMTAGVMNSEPNTSEPVNEKEEYCTVMKTKLQNYTILYSAEVDGVDPSFFNTHGKNPASMERYMELKTSRILATGKQNRNFCRYKLLKWWLQSFLAGIPKVICGFRDDDGIVRNLSIYNVKDMPKMATGLWSPSACLNFCSHFLGFVKECVVKDDPKVVYKFYWKPGQDITCEELSSPSEYQILPEWYISSLNAL